MTTNSNAEIKLAEAELLLKRAYAEIEELRQTVDSLTSVPNTYGIITRVNEDGTVDIKTEGGRLRVSINGAELETVAFNPVGAVVALNEHLNIIFIREPNAEGQIFAVKETLPDGRVVVSGSAADETLALRRSFLLEDEILRPGDLVRVDEAYHIVEKMPRMEVENLLLEEVPNISYEDIGGLAAQIEEITDAIELPIVHAERYERYALPSPKGVLLYGPPGCGKTLIAKAVAASIAKHTGAKGSFFINIKGPELLSKWVGETERQLRLVFQRAREKAEQGHPVVIFFDEMDSLFRTRGSGVSSDMEATVVPQLLAEMDGVESLKNVIVIGASNRQDLLDPALLRPGRLDVKIKVERPDKQGALEIFHKHLTEDIPLTASVLQLAQETVEYMYREAKDTEFLEVTYQNGDKEVLYFKDFASGAMVANIVSRAKKFAIKREIKGGKEGVSHEDLLRSVDQEFRENEDLPNTTSPDDWSKISGRKSDKIVNIRTLANFEVKEPLKVVHEVAVGQYL